MQGKKKPKRKGHTVERVFFNAGPNLPQPTSDPKLKRTVCEAVENALKQSQDMLMNPDIRDREEHQDVAANLARLPDAHPTRVAYAEGADTI